MVLTTHFMDEADILGDRIGIMARGQLRCCGTSIFLKQQYGGGYNLAFAKKTSNEARQLQAVVKRRVPDSVVLSNIGTELKFQLPLSRVSEFWPLFEELESRQDDLGFESYGIGMTTMEEVFLRVAAEHEAHDEEMMAVPIAVDRSNAQQSSSCGGDVGATALSGVVSPQEEVSQCGSFSMHLRAMLFKRAQYGMRDRKSQCCNTVTPVFLLWFGLYLMYDVFGSAATKDCDNMHLSVDMLKKHEDLILPFNASYPLRPDFTHLDYSQDAEDGAPSIDPAPKLLLSTQGDLQAFPTAETVYGAAYEMGEAAGGASTACPTEPSAILAMSQRLLQEGMGTELEEVVYGALLFPKTLGRCCRDRPLDCDQIQLIFVTVLGLDCEVTMRQLAGPAGFDFLKARLGSSKANLISLVLGGGDGGGFIRGGGGDGDDGQQRPQLPGVDPTATPEEQVDQLLHSATDTLAAVLQTLSVLGMPEMAQASLTNFCPFNCRSSGQLTNNIAYTPCSVVSVLMGNINAAFTAPMTALRFAGLLDRRDSVLFSCDTTPVEVIATLQPLSNAFSACIDEYPMTCGVGLQTALPSGMSTQALQQLLDGLNATAGQLVEAGMAAANLAQSCPNTCDRCNNTTNATASPRAGDEEAHQTHETMTPVTAGRLLPSLLTILYNSSFTHAAPVFLALGDSAMKAANDGAAGSISVHTHPLPWTYWEKNGSIYSVVVGIVQSLVVCLFVLIAFSFVPGALVEFTVREREHNHNAKHQQYVSGGSIPAYWTANYIWDFTVFIIPMTACLLLCLWFDVAPVVKGGMEVAFALLAGYGLSICPFTYLMGHLFKTHVKAQIYTILFNLMTGIVLMIASYVLTAFDKTHDANEILMWVYRIFPGFCLGHGLLQLFINNSEIAAAATSSLNGGKTTLLWSWDVCGKDLIYLYISAVIYFLCVLGYDLLRAYPAMEVKLRALIPRSDGSTGRTTSAPSAAAAATCDGFALDVDVAAEEARVGSGSADKEAVQLNRLRKAYGEQKVAVKALSLGIPTGT